MKLFNKYSKKIKFKKVYNSSMLTAFAAVFAVAGLVALFSSFAAPAPEGKSAEGEATTTSINTTIVIDATASGGSYMELKQESVTPPPTAKIRRFPGDPNPKLYNKAYWGAGIDGGGDPARHEDPTGKSLSVRRTFYSWSQATNMSSFMYSTVADDVSNNRLPFVSIKPAGWKATADGVYDTQIDSILRRLDSYGKPVWFVVHHEPEGGGEIGNTPDDPGGPSEWRRMQQKIRQRMNAVETKNIAFMPVLMTYTWNPASKRTPNDWWVDGIWDAYCVDHYNLSQNNNMFSGGSWNPFLAWVEQKDIPYCLGEWGNTGIDTTTGQEMRDFWDWNFTNNKDMVAYAYFDSNLNSTQGGWELKGEPLNIFQDILKNDQRVQRINEL